MWTYWAANRFGLALNQGVESEGVDFPTENLQVTTSSNSWCFVRQKFSRRGTKAVGRNCSQMAL